MKNNHFSNRNRYTAFFTMLTLFGLAQAAITPLVSYQLANNSAFPDDQIYIAISGNGDINGIEKHVWVDCKTSVVKQKLESDNTISLPANIPNPGGTMFADIFTKLSDIPNKTVVLPPISSCRILIAFKHPLYIHFFADGGSTAPDLNNATDPNIGIRFEMIELTSGVGIFINTTRVDTYQYPMGLEVFGKAGDKITPSYGKVGDLMHHDEIIAKWKAEAPAPYQDCLDPVLNIIKFPTKVPSWKSGEKYGSEFTSYIDQIWTKYKSEDLIFGVKDRGQWKGRVNANNQFEFTSTEANGTVVKALIDGKPTQEEVLEGSGLFNKITPPGNGNDLMIEAQLCAAINRHALDISKPAATVQDFSDDTKYYTIPTYNWYSGFWHNPAVSYNKYTYAFCYDDVFDKSSTLQCPYVERVLITVGGFASPIGAHYPTVGAGEDINIILPTNSVNLTGTAVDMDNKSMTYKWEKISGDKGMISSPTTLSTSVKGLGIGEYIFRLTASNGVLSEKDEVRVKVDPDPNALNLALNKPSTSSSSVGNNNAVAGNDGSTGTRWESLSADPQWYMVDLENTYLIEGVKIIWEAAASKSYTLEVSTDGITDWKNIYTTTHGTGGTEFISCSGIGRFIRLSSTARTTNYGVSFFEIQVFGTDNITTLNTTNNVNFGYYPNPVSEVLNILGAQENSIVEVYSIQGNKLLETVGSSINVSVLSTGIYIIHIGDKSMRFTKK